MELSDVELIKECLENDKEAFAELVKRYKKLVYSVVYNMIYNKHEVYDISQEVFIRVYKNLDKYNPKYKFSTWIVRITTNLCLDMNRKKRVDTASLQDYETFVGDNSTPEGEYIKKEKRKWVLKSVDELPEKYRTPILLFHKNNLSYDEISKALNQPMSIVKNRIYRARIMLKEKLSLLHKEEIL